MYYNIALQTMFTRPHVKPSCFIVQAHTGLSSTGNLVSIRRCVYTHICDHVVISRERRSIHARGERIAPMTNACEMRHVEEDLINSANLKQVH